MKATIKNLFKKAVSVFVPIIFVLTMSNSLIFAAASAINMKHEPPAYFVPEKRMILRAAISQGDADVKFIGSYFRAVGQADYVFITMDSIGNGLYAGILPAPSKETQTIEYLFLIVDRDNKPLKTQVYTVNKKDGKDTPTWQQVDSEGTIQVSTELANAPASVPGFSDSIFIDVVESSARFGVVAGGGAYALKGTAGASAATASATAGTTAATASVASASAAAAGTGLSTAAMIGIGAGAAALAVGGGIAAANSSKGDDDTPPPASDVISTWEFHSKCASSSIEAPVVFSIQLNETKGTITPNPVSGSGQRADYEDGMPITMSMSSNYDTKTRALSGSISTTASKLMFSCERHDSFTISVPSGTNDTGYQNVVEQGSTGCGSESGCVMQVKFIRK